MLALLGAPSRGEGLGVGGALCAALVAGWLRRRSLAPGPAVLVLQAAPRASLEHLRLRSLSIFAGPLQVVRQTTRLEELRCDMKRPLTVHELHLISSLPALRCLGIKMLTRLAEEEMEVAIELARALRPRLEIQYEKYR